jgi:hypothetical protein
LEQRWCRVFKTSTELEVRVAAAAGGHAGDAGLVILVIVWRADIRTGLGDIRIGFGPALTVASVAIRTGLGNTNFLGKAFSEFILVITAHRKSAIIFQKGWILEK